MNDRNSSQNSVGMGGSNNTRGLTNGLVNRITAMTISNTEKAEEGSSVFRPASAPLRRPGAPPPRLTREGATLGHDRPEEEAAAVASSVLHGSVPVDIKDTYEQLPGSFNRAKSRPTSAFAQSDNGSQRRRSLSIRRPGTAVGSTVVGTIPPSAASSRPSSGSSRAVSVSSTRPSSRIGDGGEDEDDLYDEEEGEEGEEGPEFSDLGADDFISPEELVRPPTPPQPMTKTSSRPTSPAQHTLMRPSLFPNTSATVRFVAPWQTVIPPPSDQGKMLRWKSSTITPQVVRRLISRSHFKITTKESAWLAVWGKHMKPPLFRDVREHQKVNHFPGSFQIGRKDRLWRNLSAMQAKFGHDQFSFFPQTFCLPADTQLLKRHFDENNTKQRWILKPPASARGIGIRLVTKWNQIPKKKPVIIQKYLAAPYLINEAKFDIRLYVYVSCYEPLRAYIFNDGLVRFASMKYSNSVKTVGNRFMHLTNYSINKYSSQYEENADHDVCQGHKWSLLSLWTYLEQRNIDASKIWSEIKDLVVKTLIAAEPHVVSAVKANVRQRSCVHELFGFDVLLDQKLKPWIIEVNISPSLHSESQLDIDVKETMMKDLLNLSGIKLPTSAEANPPSLASDERAKHLHFVQRHKDPVVTGTILDTLTPDDTRLLCESVDEDSRRGAFERIMPPNSGSHKYLQYFEQPRYYNLLLEAWFRKYRRRDEEGAALLRELCRRRLHQDSPTTNPKHIWKLPRRAQDTSQGSNGYS